MHTGHSAPPSSSSASIRRGRCAAGAPLGAGTTRRSRVRLDRSAREYTGAITTHQLQHAATRGPSVVGQCTARKSARDSATRQGGALCQLYNGVSRVASLCAQRRAVVRCARSTHTRARVRTRAARCARVRVHTCAPLRSVCANHTSTTTRRRQRHAQVGQRV